MHTQQSQSQPTPSSPPVSSQSLADRLRADFPILQTTMNGKPLIYFDNGATTQKPQCVIDALVHYYSHDNANIHRGLYELSQRATDQFEAARKNVAEFLGASSPVECIFVRGTTEAINLVANSWGSDNLGPGNEVLITGLEHHSNIVPWQMCCQRTGATLRVIPVTSSGELDYNELDKLLTDSTTLVAIQHVSNALGTVHDVERIIRQARRVGAKVLIDGAQWIAHGKTDVQQLGCDFYVFSGHKLYGPTGIGVLWGRRELLETMSPWQGGGDMIETVSFAETTYAALPNKFEAGTPDIAGAIALSAAIDYVRDIGLDEIGHYENEIAHYARQRMSDIDGVRIIGSAAESVGVVSFVIEQPAIAAIDIAMHLSGEGIAVRTGHHCCMPLMSSLQVPGTCRVSLAMYNTVAEIDRLCDVLNDLIDARRTSHTADSSPVAEGQIEFAPPAADSPNAAADDLAEEFLLFDDHQSKTEFLLELGDSLPDRFAALKEISAPVPGCMSQVYLIGRPVPGDDNRYEFTADSDAQIVRGLIAILLALYSGQSKQAILDFDMESFFRRIGLDQFVSTQRRSGLNGMIRRVRTLVGGQ